MKTATLVLSLALFLLARPSFSQLHSRQPRLFLVSTSSTTSTPSTNTVCFFTSTANAGDTIGACKKRKRSINIGGVGAESVNIDPSRTSEAAIESALEKEDRLFDSNREGRLLNLLYWITTTTTSTSTVYTATLTIAS